VRGGERLPVDVRLARERLLQRLRGGEPLDRNRFHFDLTLYSFLILFTVFAIYEYY
jgi:hypothetical protein